MRLSAVAFVPAAFFAVAALGQPWRTPPDNFGGAVPLNRNEWYNFNDYPTSAVSGGEEGYVTVSFTIGTDGHMSDCRVVRSSHYPDLDAVPCKVLPKRARFSPAHDGSGAPIITQGTASMAFWTAG